MSDTTTTLCCVAPFCITAVLLILKYLILGPRCPVCGGEDIKQEHLFKDGTGPAIGTCQQCFLTSNPDQFRPTTAKFNEEVEVFGEESCNDLIVPVALAVLFLSGLTCLAGHLLLSGR